MTFSYAEDYHFVTNYKADTLRRRYDELKQEGFVGLTGTKDVLEAKA